MSSRVRHSPSPFAFGAVEARAIEPDGAKAIDPDHTLVTDIAGGHLLGVLDRASNDDSDITALASIQILRQGQFPQN